MEDALYEAIFWKLREETHYFYIDDCNLGSNFYHSIYENIRHGDLTMLKVCLNDRKFWHELFGFIDNLPSSDRVALCYRIERVMGSVASRLIVSLSSTIRFFNRLHELRMDLARAIVGLLAQEEGPMEVSESNYIGVFDGRELRREPFCQIELGDACYEAEEEEDWEEYNPSVIIHFEHLGPKEMRLGSMPIDDLFHIHCALKGHDVVMYQD